MDPSKQITVLCTLFFFGLLFSAPIQKEKIVFYDGELSPLEKTLLAENNGKTFSNLPLFKAYLIASMVTNETEVDELMSNYQKKIGVILREATGLQGEALAQKICRSMHKDLLKEYSFDAIYPGPLLKTGLFNCVSSSAVYADLLSRLGIGYEFAFVEKHVFLYAFINNNKILCEPTSPLGFNAGNTSITNDDGSVETAFRTAYTGVTPAHAVSFMASRYYDGRMLARFATADEYGQHLLSKKGLALFPEDPVLASNYVAFTLGHLNKLVDAGKWEAAGKIACDTFRPFTDTRPLENFFIHNFEKIAGHHLRQENPGNAEALFETIKTSANPAYAAQVAERAYIRACQELLRKNQVDKADLLSQRGARSYPGSTLLTENEKNVGLLKAASSQDIEKILSAFSIRIQEKPDDARLPDELLYNLTPLLRSAIQRGRFDEADRAIEKIKALCGKERADRAVGLSYGNLVYESLNTSAWFDALTFGRAGAKWGFNTSTYQNYLAAFYNQVVSTYSNGNTENALRVVREEVLAGQTNARFFEVLNNALSKILKTELVSRQTNQIGPLLAALTNYGGPGAMDNALTYSFNNAIYELTALKEYEKALIVGDAALKLSSLQNVWKNYTYALSKYAENRVTEKDPVGAMRALSERIARHPQITTLVDIPDAVFRDHIVGLLKAGQESAARQIFLEFAKVLPKEKAVAFSTQAYLSASYSLIQEKKYRQAVVVGERGLAIKDDPALFGNYRTALLRHFEGDTNVTETLMISNYAAAIKKYPLKTELRKDVVSLAVRARVEEVKNGNTGGLSLSLKRLSVHLTPTEVSNAAGNLYTSATYHLHAAKNYTQSMAAAEEGFGATSDERLTQNYLASFHTLARDLLARNELTKTKELLARAKKRFPTAKEIGWISEAITGKEIKK